MQHKVYRTSQETVSAAEQDTGICLNYQHPHREVPGKTAIALLSQLATAKFLWVRTSVIGESTGHPQHGTERIKQKGNKAEEGGKEKPTAKAEGTLSYDVHAASCGKINVKVQITMKPKTPKPVAF